MESEIIKVRSKLANPDFVKKVPASVLNEHQEREGRWKERLTLLQGMLEKIS